MSGSALWLTWHKNVGVSRAKAALERQFVEAGKFAVVDGRVPVVKPMALAWAVRA